MISLVIAIVAIINEKNRKHLLLMFSYLDFILYFLLFLLINYFVFFNQFYNKGYIIHSLFFEKFGLSDPSYYSYLISILVLITVLIKVTYSFYPSRKIRQVIIYYQGLIENGEIPMLLDIIEKYHLNDIVNNIRSSKNHIPKNILLERFRKETVKETIVVKFNFAWQNINKYSKVNRYNYAQLVLHNVLNDPALISLASNVRPYLFARIFSTFKKEKSSSFPHDLVNHYITELLKQKNFWLIKELKQSDNFDSGQPDWFFSENKIIASLIQDVSVADVNEIWRPFGEEAIKEIESEKNNGSNSRLFQQYRNDDILWEYKLFISVKFFNILIIESIIQEYNETHFFLHYYWHMTEKILENFNSTPPTDFEEIESNYHFIINQMNDNLFHWLTLANDKGTDRLYDIIRCIGNQIDCITKSPYFGEERKISLVERVLHEYCNIEEKTKTDLLRDELDGILLKPSMLTKPAHPYYNYISQAWERLDKIPHRNYDSTDFDYFARLKNNVILPLGLNPDEY